MWSKTTLDPTFVYCMDKKYIFQNIIFWFPQKKVSRTGLEGWEGCVGQLSCDLLNNHKKSE